MQARLTHEMKNNKLPVSYLFLALQKLLPVSIQIGKEAAGYGSFR